MYIIRMMLFYRVRWQSAKIVARGTASKCLIYFNNPLNFFKAGCIVQPFIIQNSANFRQGMITAVKKNFLAHVFEFLHNFF